MFIASTRLIVPTGLRDSEIEDWFRCSNKVRKKLSTSEDISRRRFLKNSAAISLAGVGTGATGFLLAPNKSEAQTLTLITAIISFLNIVLPAVASLQIALKPRDQIPAREKLKSDPSQPSSRYGHNLLAVVDQDTLRVESASARQIYQWEGLGSSKFESAEGTLLRDSDWGFDDQYTFNIENEPLVATKPGYKSLVGLTEPSSEKASFKVESS